MAPENNVKYSSKSDNQAYQKYGKGEKQRQQSSSFGHVYGQKKTKIVTDRQYATLLAQLLKDLHFPASKEKIIQFILENKSSSVSRSQTVDIFH